MKPALQQIFSNAALRPGGWDAALKALASATHSARVQVLGIGGPSNIPFNHIANLGDDRHLTEFLDINGGSPEVNWRVALAAPVMTVVHEKHYASVAGLRRFDVYNDFARKYDMIHGCQTVLASGRGGMLGLATLRGRADGVSDHADIELFAAIAPSVLDAIRLQQAIEHQGTELLAGALDAMQAAVILLDATGAIIAMTREAEALVVAQDTLAVRDRALRALDRPSDTRLQAGIARVLATPAPDVSGRLWLAATRSGTRGLVCELFALPPQDWNFGTAPRALVSLRSVDATAGDSQTLRQAFDLSAAEADVALLVAQGLSRDEIALRRRVSPETIASQLKTIFRKTDVRSQAQLASLVGRMAPRR